MHLTGTASVSVGFALAAPWAHADSKGFNIQLETVPLDGRIALRVASEKTNNPQLGRASQSALYSVIRQKIAACSGHLILLQSRRSEKICEQKNLTTDLRLRLLSNSKLVISHNGHGSRHAHIGRARKRSVKGIPVPELGRE
jgi:hypothetical protein